MTYRNMELLELVYIYLLKGEKKLMSLFCLFFAFCFFFLLSV